MGRKQLRIIRECPRIGLDLIQELLLELVCLGNSLLLEPGFRLIGLEMLGLRGMEGLQEPGLVLVDLYQDSRRNLTIIRKLWRGILNILLEGVEEKAHLIIGVCLKKDKSLLFINRILLTIGNLGINQVVKREVEQQVDQLFMIDFTKIATQGRDQLTKSRNNLKLSYHPKLLRNLKKIVDSIITKKK